MSDPRYCVVGVSGTLHGPILESIVEAFNAQDRVPRSYGMLAAGTREAMSAAMRLLTSQCLPPSQTP